MVVDVVEITDCSFPFTYNGGMYYGCAENVLNVSTAEQPFACLALNYTELLCDISAGSYRRSVSGAARGPGGHGSPRYWVHKNIPGCAVELNT